MPDAEDAGAATGAAAAAAAAAEATAEPVTDQWVQCDRCRTWRIVPDQHWPSVEADPRDVSSPLLPIILPLRYAMVVQCPTSTGQPLRLTSAMHCMHPWSMSLCLSRVHLSLLVNAL